jgi:hypothetical protein
MCPSVLTSDAGDVCRLAGLQVYRYFDLMLHMSALFQTKGLVISDAGLNIYILESLLGFEHGPSSL